MPINFPMTQALINFSRHEIPLEETAHSLALVTAQEEWCINLKPLDTLTNEAIETFDQDKTLLDHLAHYTPELLPQVSTILGNLTSDQLYKIIINGFNAGMYFPEIISRYSNLEILNKISLQVGEFSHHQLKNMTQDSEGFEYQQTSFIQRIIDAAKNINYNNAFKAIFSDTKEKGDIYSILKTTEPKLDLNEILNLARNYNLKKLEDCCEHLLQFQPFYSILAVSKSSKFIHPKANEIFDFPNTITTLLSLSKTSNNPQEENNHETEQLSKRKKL